MSDETIERHAAETADALSPGHQAETVDARPALERAVDTRLAAHSRAGQSRLSPEGESGSPHLAAFRRAIGDRYEVLDILGQGGMGVVFRARDRRALREVALKITLGPSTPRFAREAEVTAQLDHPGIVRVHDFGDVSGIPYIAYELVAGEGLDVRAASAPREQRLAWLIEVARAVGHAHQRGVVHRDLKPSNVVIADEGRARVLDFGVAYAAHLDSLTRSDAMVGTVAYAAPEQLLSQRDKLGPPADVWSLGVLLYQLLTDEEPFQAPGLGQLVTTIVSARPTPPRRLDRSISPAVERVCLRALTSEPDQRFPQADAFADALEAALSGRSPARSRGWFGAALAGAAVLGFTLATLSSVLRPPPQASSEATDTPTEAEGDAGGEVEPIALSRLPLAIRPGLSAHPQRQVEVVDGVGLVLTDPAFLTDPASQRRHLGLGGILRSFDIESLAWTAARRVSGAGSPLLAAGNGRAVTAARDGTTLQVWALPGLDPLATCEDLRPPILALTLEVGGSRALVSCATERVLVDTDSGRVLRRDRALVPASHLATASDGVLAMLAHDDGSASLQRWSWEGRVLAEQPARACRRIRVDPQGARALTLLVDQPVVQLWRLGADGGLALERTVELIHRSSTILDILPGPSWDEALVIDRGGRIGVVSLAGQRGTYRRLAPALLTGIARAGDRVFLGGRDAMLRVGGFEPQWTYTTDHEVHEGPITSVAGRRACEWSMHQFMHRGIAELARGLPSPTDADDRWTLLSQPLVASPVLGSRKGSVFMWAKSDEPVGLAAADHPTQQVRRRVGLVSLLPGEHRLLLGFEDGSVGLLNGREVFEIVPADGSTLTALAADRLGDVAVFAREGVVARINIGQGRSRPLPLFGLGVDVTTLWIDSRWVVAGGADGRTWLYDIDEGQVTARLPGVGAVTALCPLGLHAGWLVGTADGRIRLWDPDDGAVVGQATLPDLDFARDIDHVGTELQVGTQLGRVYALTLPRTR